MGEFDHIFFDSTGKLYSIWDLRSNTHPGTPPSLVSGRQPQLIQAILDRRPHCEVLHLIKTLTEVNSAGSNRITALHAAAFVNNPEIVKALLEHGAKKSACDKYGYNPLQTAIINGAGDCLKLLDSELECEDRQWRTALHLATIFGYARLLQSLLQDNAMLLTVNNLDKCRASALYYAALFNQIECADVLLRFGADIDLRHKNDYTALHVAASVNSITALLLENGAQPDLQTFQGNTALHLSCMNGQLPSIHLLTARGADISLKNKRGQTALHLAVICSQNTLEIVDLLLKNGADLNAQDANGLTALHLAIIHAKFVLFERLTDKNGANVSICDFRRNSPLHYAVRYGHDVLIAALMKNGADPNCKGYANRTPLHVACLANSVESSRKLLKCHCDNIDAVDAKGRTALHLAAYKGAIGCLDLLLSKGAKIDVADKLGRLPLHYAAQQGHFEAVFTLVGAGTEVNRRDERGVTALHLAAGYERASSECLEYLVVRGADLHAADAKGYIALHYALVSCNFRSVVSLIEAMGATKVFEEDGKMPLTTPLHLAAKMGNLDVLRLVLSYFTRYDMRTEDGYTALILTGIYGHFECMELLLKFGADISICDNRLRTVLFYCAYYGRRQGLEMVLLQENAKDFVNAVDDLNLTPLSAAAMNNHADCVRLLLKNGADPNICDKFQCSPLMLAMADTVSSAEIFEMLLNHNANPKHCEQNGKSVFILATQLNQLKCIEKLIPHLDNADYYRLDGNDFSAMHWAAYCKRDKIVALLLHLHTGSSRNKAIFPGNQFTPIHCAALTGQRYIIAQFLQHFHRHDILNTCDQLGRTPLHICALAGQRDTAAYLLTMGCNVSKQDHSGLTAAMTATRMKHILVCSEIVSRTKSDFEQDILGNTVLHWACIRNSIATALLLLKKYKDHKAEAEFLNCRNQIERQAIHYATANGMYCIVEKLLMRSAVKLDYVDFVAIEKRLRLVTNVAVEKCCRKILKQKNAKLTRNEGSSGDVVEIKRNERIFDCCNIILSNSFLQ